MAFRSETDPEVVERMVNFTLDLGAALEARGLDVEDISVAQWERLAAEFGSDLWQESIGPALDRLYAELEADAEEEVTCKLCAKPVSARTAHVHQGGFVGDECGCWDERLRSSE